MFIRTLLRFPAVALLALSLLAVSLSAVADDTRSVVRIPYADRQQLTRLVEIVAPWEARDGVVIADVSPAQLELLKKAGFRWEVLYRDRREMVEKRGGAAVSALDAGLYHTYEEVKAELAAIAADHPDIAMVVDIGDSWEKSQGIADRDILAIKLSGNVAVEEDEPEVLFVGAHHAREWISVEVPLMLARHLADNYATDPLIRSQLDNGAIWIVPMVNPDGHHYSVVADRWWRKNRRLNADGSYGVDLNRNYGYQWGGPGSSSDPRSDTYRGTAPFSEPESQAIRDLGLAHDFEAMITYHNYSQLVLYPWGYDSVAAPEKRLLDGMAREMADLIQGVHGVRYTPQQSSELYLSSGTTDDWFYGELGTWGFTIELRPKGFPWFFELPESQIVPTFEENLPAALHLISWAESPEPAPDVKANGLDTAVVLVQGEPLEITAALAAGNRLGGDADWWMVAESPMGPYHYRAASDRWVAGDGVTWQGPIQELPARTVLDMSTLPPGDYLFRFGIDVQQDGIIDPMRVWWDEVSVTILPAR